MWPFSLYGNSGSSNSFVQDSGGGGGFDWGRLLMGGLGMLGTGLGAYSLFDSRNQQQDAYNFARRQAQQYAADAQAYQAQQAAWRNQMMGMMTGYIGKAMSAMNAPLDAGPDLTDAALKAGRRSVLANRALSTGGNVGGYVDDLVAERAIKDTLTLKEAQARMSALANQNKMVAWPAILSALASMMGAGAPAAPLRPVDVPMPSAAGAGAGIGAFGDFLKWDAQNRAMEAERQANAELRRKIDNWYTRGPSSAPSVYNPVGPSEPYFPWDEGYNF